MILLNQVNKPQGELLDSKDKHWARFPSKGIDIQGVTPKLLNLGRGGMGGKLWINQ